MPSRATGFQQTGSVLSRSNTWRLRDRRWCRIGPASCRELLGYVSTTSCLPAARQRKHAQNQRQDRPCAERRPSPVIPVQQDEQRRDARGQWRGRTSRTLQHVSNNNLRRRPSPGQLGLDHRPASPKSRQRLSPRLFPNAIRTIALNLQRT